MVKFSREKVLLLHQLIAQETGVASGAWTYEKLLAWVKEHLA